MRKLLQYIILISVLIGTSAYFVYTATLNPCKKPFEYKIGRFDSQFGISKENFKAYIAEAEIVWEKTLDSNIFRYNPNADFEINLIYDERQLTTVQKQKTEFGLSAIETVFKKLDAEFDLFKSEYDKKISLYEQSLALFKSRKSAYDSEVAFWNSRGGAPKGKFESLEAERMYLNTEAARLNAEVIAVNAMARQLNTLLKERNTKALEYNKIAEDYNRKYNDGLEFNQAEYTNKQINIYQFSDKKDLILAISHEFGHTLGLDHVKNSRSIMYYITGINAEITPTLSGEDLAELKRVCKL